MNCTYRAYQIAARSLAFALAATLFADCGGASHMLPSAMLPDEGAPTLSGAAAPHPEAAGGPVGVRMQIRIPRRGRNHARSVHPATISGLTKSVGIAVNGGPNHVFETTPASPGCSIGVSGTTCTFTMLLKPGTDTFVVTTYAGAGGTGVTLDRGTATVPIVKGKVNAIAVRLGPAVSTTADNGEGSLRYAIGSANPGDTILFLLPAGSTIALASPIDITGNVSLAGPGAATPITISGGNLHQLFLVAGTATISGLTLAQGKAAVADTPGGAIANVGSLTLANDKIGANTSIVSVIGIHHRRTIPNLRRRPHCSTTDAFGGAIYNAGTLTMTGTTFNGNVVLSDLATCVDGLGGAIYNDVPGTISSTGDTFTNNSAMQGGAVYNAGLGQVSFTNDTFTANAGCTATTGCPTSGCTSAGCTTFAQGDGAAIFDAGSGVTIASSTFTNNVVGGLSNGSAGEGGALLLGSGSPTVTGSAFTGNLAGGGSAGCSTGQGGAIAALVPIALNNDSFTNNRAAGDGTSVGGAVVVATGTVEASNDTFKGNTAVGAGSACATSSQGVGGALFAGVAATLTNDTFANNTASGNGTGGGGAVGCISCYLSGNTFTSNAAIGSGAAGAASSLAAGGAVYGQSIIKMTANTFTSNTVTAEGPHALEAYGGAVAISSGTISSGGNTFTSNGALEAGGTGTAAGGALVSLGGTTVSTDDVFKSNVAHSSGTTGGGAVFLAGSFLVSDATVSGNRAAGGATALGGGFAFDTVGELTKDTFTGNAVTAASGPGAGGAIYGLAGEGVLDSTFTGNSANAAGGAIVSGGASVILDSTISGNVVTAATASAEGGGGIFSASTLSVTQSSVANNSVTVGGAGTSGGGGILSAGALTLESSTVSGNAVLGSAPSSGGGGIFNGAAATLTNDTISNNVSKLNGGGIDIAANDAVTLENVTLFKNAAVGAGGNIDNPFAITLTNSVVAGGTAASGGDIKNTGTLTSGDYNIVQTAVVGNPFTGTTTHDKIADPLLLALSNNGGPTFTNADQATSPGKAYIPFSGGHCGSVSLPQDQRGYTRGAGGRCDVGAFEIGGVPSAARHRAQPRRPASPSGFGLRFRPIRLHALRLAPLWTESGRPSL